MFKRRGGDQTAQPAPQQHTGGGSMKARAIEHVPVWAAAGCLPPGAYALSHLFVNEASALSTGLYGAGALGLSAALTSVTWKVAQARGNFVRGLATGSVAAGTLWEFVASLTGPFAPGMWQTWAAGTVGLCGAWSIRRALRGHGADTHAPAEAGVLGAISAGRARWGQPRVDGSTVRVPVQTEGTPVPLQQNREELEARLSAALPGGLHPGSVTVTRDQKHAHMAEVTIATVDVLSQTIPWPGVARQGRSIAEPVRIGHYGDGSPLDLTFPGEGGRTLLHLLSSGASGAGKSSATRVGVAEASQRADVETIFIDPGKGVQTVADIEHLLDYAVWSEEGDLDTARALCQEAVKGLVRAGMARANWLGKHGYQQWQPGCGIPFSLVIIDELALLANAGRALVDLLATCRSGGMSVWGSLQRATWDNIDTSARANFNGALAFRVRDSKENEVALTEDAIDSGAEPHRISPDRAGVCYAAGPGLDPMKIALQARSFDITPAQLRALPGGHRGLCSVTADAIGPAYQQWAQANGRTVRGTVTLTRPQASAPATTSTNTGNFEEGLADMWDQMTADIDADVDPDGPDPVVADLPFEDGEALPDIDTSLDESDPEPAEMPLGSTGAVAAVRAQIVEWASRGRLEFSPADFNALLDRVGRQSSWLSKQLAALVEREWLYAVGTTRNRMYRIDASQVLADGT